jgi:RNA polymerase sigma-70 factor (ECF subfamily)
MEKALTGDILREKQAAFETLYNHLYNPVLDNIMALVQEEDKAKDIVQDVFLGLWDTRDKFHHVEDVKSWLITASYRSSLDYLKSTVEEREFTQMLKKPDSSTAEKHEVDEVDYRKLFRNTLSLLPERKKMAIEMCKLEGKTYKEAAGLLGVTPLTVKQYVAEGLRFIRKYVRRQSAALAYFIWQITELNDNLFDVLI